MGFVGPRYPSAHARAIGPSEAAFCGEAPAVHRQIFRVVRQPLVAHRARGAEKGSACDRHGRQRGQTPIRPAAAFRARSAPAGRNLLRDGVYRAAEVVGPLRQKQ